MILNINGEHDEETLQQLHHVAEQADYVALMADGHRGYIMPIGGVAAYRNHVSVTGVGFDIGCGNSAVCIGQYLDPSEDCSELADEIADAISFGVGQNNPRAPRDHAIFNDPAWDIIPRNIRTSLRDKARNQLGTVGGGNHYVDVFTDQQGKIWVGNHFGSRGFGHTIASSFLAIGTGGEWGDRGNDAQEVLLDLDTQVGSDYMELMRLAGEYAFEGRLWVLQEVLRILGTVPESKLVVNHHNYAWRESHFGEEYVVVRKGATPSFPGQESFVGGSMGSSSVILRGTDSSLAQGNLFSTVHGAGRVMGRMQAKGKWRNGRCVREGQVTHEMMREATRGVEVRGGDLDESPHVYKNLDDVLAYQGPTIEIVEVLTPLIVCMAPARTVDPYKD